MTRASQEHLGHAESGFTFIEILVALAILSLALAVILPAMVAGMDALERAANATETVELVQSLLANEEASLPSNIGETGGVAADGEHWEADAEPWAGDNTPRRIGAYKIVISVTRSGHTETFLTLLSEPVANVSP